MSVLQPLVMTLLNVGILFLLEMVKLVEGASTDICSYN